MAIEVGTAYISILPSTEKLASGIKAALKNSEKESARSGRRSGGNFASGFKTATKGLALGIGGIATGIIGFGVKTAAEFEQTQIALETLMGSSKRARREMAWLSDKAAATPFELADLSAADKTLLAFGFTADKVRRQFLLDMGNIAAAVGLPSERLPDLAKIFGQVQAAGRVSMEDINQLIDAGVPVWDALGKATGKSVAEMRDAISKGQIDAQTFNGALQKMSRTRFGDAMSKQSQTLAGLWSSLKDNFAIGAMNMVQPFAPLIKDAMPKLATLTEQAGIKGAQFAGYIRSDLVPAAAQFGSYFKSNILPVLKDVGNVITGTVLPAAVSFGKWLFDHKPVVLGLVGAFVAYKATLAGIATAQSVAAVAQSAWGVATKAASAAQWLWNAAVGAGTKVALGTRIQLALLRVQTVALSVAQKAAAGAQWALNLAMNANPLGLIVAAVVAVVAVLAILWKKNDGFRRAMIAAWTAIKTAVMSVWNGGIKPVFTAIGTWVTTKLIPLFKNLYNGVVKPVFAGIKRVVTTYLRGVMFYFRLVVGFVRGVVFPVLRGLWNSVVKPVFTGIGATIRGTWNGVIRPVFNALAGFITNKVKPAFKKGIDAVGRIWEGLKETARKPVEFLVNTVYNNGIRAMMNKIPGINLPAASFATGGWTGPGSKFTPAGVVHADEFVINKGARRNIEKQAPGLLGYMNQHGSIPGYASGGRVWPLPGGTPSTYPGHDGVDLNAPGDLGKPFLAAAPGTVTHAGYGRGYGNAVFVRGSYGELVYGHGLDGSLAVSPGQSVIAGQILGRVGSTGNSSGPHLHFGFPGGSYSGALAFLAGAARTSGVSSAAIKKDEKDKDHWWNVVTEVPKLAKRVWSNIKGMSSSGFAGEFKKGGTGLLRSAVNYGDDKIPDMLKLKYLPDVNLPNTPIMSALKAVGIFDNGGVLEPGKFAFNASSKPEAVFNQQQFKKFAESAGSGGSRGRRTAMTITNWQDGTGYFEEIASDMIDGEMDYQNNRGRMG